VGQAAAGGCQPPKPHWIRGSQNTPPVTNRPQEEKLRAAWYEHQGDPYHSLVVGEMPDPVPGAGEVRIAVTVSGLSPGDVKKRSGWQGSAMSYPRVIPHSDGAGTIDAVGPGVTQDRIGEPSPTGRSAPPPSTSQYPATWPCP
jgi:hypothetical protein